MKTVKDVEINLNQGKVVKNAQDLCSLRRNSLCSFLGGDNISVMDG